MQRSRRVIISCALSLSCSEHLSIGSIERSAASTAPDTPAPVAAAGATAADAAVSAAEDVHIPPALDVNRPPTPCADALVCDGFDGVALSEPSVGPTGQVSLSQELVLAGTGALAASTNGDLDYARVSYDLPNIVSGSVYWRLHLFVKAGSVQGLINVFSLMPEGGNGIDINLLRDGALEVYFHETTPPRYASGARLWPEERWFCLRGHADISATAGQVVLELNEGTQFATPGMENSVSPGGFVKLRAGIDWADSGQGSAQLYMDDLAFGTSPLPCF